ncbi:MAG: SDR family NAD(P)-dependent oxidoreductase [Thermogutta sp.]
MNHQSFGPVALVTGSGKRRVGSFIAQMLAKRGYAVAIHYRSSRQDAELLKSELAAQGKEVEIFQADMADVSSIDRMFDQVLGRFGRLDVLVTAAAIWEPTRLELITPESVQKHFLVNAMGTFWCCRRAGLAMVEQPEGGVIITIGDWAVERPYLHYAAYFLSKGCIPTMTRVLAIELSHRNPNIRVNAIMPGPVMMPSNLPENEKVEAIRSTLLQKEGKPDHIVSAVEFLIDNDYVTGICLPVDGGRTIGG